MYRLVVGVDLAGSENRPTGICVMREDLRCYTSIARSDEEIIGIIRMVEPSVVAIDAPLSLPRGRRDLSSRGGQHFRQCDLELRKIGIKFLPITLGPMRELTERGIRIYVRIVNELGFEVIETYPGGAQDVLGIPRKSRGLDAMLRGLEGIGIRGISPKNSGDELDAATCAYVGVLYLRGEALALGDPSEGVIYLPRPRNSTSLGPRE